MKVEDVLGGMDLPRDTEMVEFGFVDDRRRLRVEALDGTYKIVEAREITVLDDDGEEDE